MSRVVGGVEIGFRLTDRDVAILKFIWEQKFASLEMLYFAFFDRRGSLSEALPKNLWVTRQRVALLRKLGFLESVRVYVEPQALYCLTFDGYQILRNREELIQEVQPLRSIDFRYFEHDRRISMCRVALQRSGKAKEWYPDRLIRRSKSFPHEKGFYPLPTSILPDAIFLNQNGDRIALELELTPKKNPATSRKSEVTSVFLIRRIRSFDKFFLSLARIALERILRKSFAIPSTIVFMS